LDRSEDLRATMAAAAIALSSELSLATEPLVASREEIAAKISKLGGPDANGAQERISTMLTKQREAMQEEVAEVRAALDSSRAELAAARGEIEELRAGQGRGRGAALEAILALATQELNSLGSLLDSGSATISSRLDKAEACADAAGDAVVGAESRSVVAGSEVQRVASAWTNDIAKSCHAVSQVAVTASEEAERSVTDVARRLQLVAEEQGASSVSTATISDMILDETDTRCAKEKEASPTESGDALLAGKLAQALLRETAGRT